MFLSNLVYWGAAVPAAAPDTMDEGQVKPWQRRLPKPFYEPHIRSFIASSSQVVGQLGA
jgi:hypothetical protein